MKTSEQTLKRRGAASLKGAGRTTRAGAGAYLSKGGLIAIMLASTATIMVGSAITPAVPAIGAQFVLGDASGWLVTMPALGVVASAMLFGRLIDRLGPYKICAVFLQLYGILGLTGFLMPNVPLLLANRFLLGVATAAVMSASTALISQFYKVERQIKMVAAQGMVIELGGVAFLSLAGILADKSWQGPFFIYAIAILAFVLLFIFVRKPAAMMATAPAAEATPLEAEAAAEAKPAKPVLPVLALAFLAMTVFFTCIVSIPSYFQGSLGYSASLSGYYLAGISLIAVCFAGIMPLAVKKLGNTRCLVIAFSSFAAGHLCLFFTSVPLLVLAVLLLGVGMGFSVPLINSLTVSRSTAANKGRNLCLYSMAIFSGQIASSLLAMVAGGRVVFGAAALIALVPPVVLVLQTITRHRRKSRAD